jgi:hypothetical protein
MRTSSAHADVAIAGIRAFEQAVEARQAPPVILGSGKRREGRPMFDCEFLEDVMKMHLDRALRNIQ